MRVAVAAAQPSFQAAPRELTLLFVAAALLLLAVASALVSRRRAAAGARSGQRAAARRLAPSVVLLVAAVGAAVAWTQLPAPTSPPAGTAATAAPSRPPPPQPFVTVTAASGRDRTMVRQAVALLRRHLELADQRRAEIDRQRLNQITVLRVAVCDVCKAEPLTSTRTIGVPSAGGVDCSVNLNTPVLRRMAQRAHVDVTSLAAMLIHHDQELCLIGPVTNRSPFAAGLRLARKLGDGRLFDLLFAQISTGPATDWLAVEQGVALLRRHGELGAQRWEELRRRRLNQVGPLQIQVCRGCLGDPNLLGDATTTQAAGDPVFCDIRIDLAVVEREARGWGLPVTLVVATLLAHEQEHCIRDPDDREIPAIDAERRLARKVGGAQLLEYVVSSYRLLDRAGHWRS